MEIIEPIIIIGIISLTLAAMISLAAHFLADAGVCEIKINGEKKVSGQGGRPLLSLLSSNGIFIPSACGGRGSCGFCKVKVLKGGGKLLPTERPYLNARDIRDLFRLACQVKARGEMELSIPREYLAIKKFNALVKSIKTLTHDVKEVLFSLDDPEGIMFDPGQYVQIDVPGDKGGPVSRAYSISSIPSRNAEVELIVKLVPGGVGSTYIHNLSEGDMVSFTGPYGDVRLHEPSGNILFVGGGAGMAPLKSMIYSIVENRSTHKIHLYFGVRAKRDIFYLEDFQRLSREHPFFTFTYALSSPSEDDIWEGEKGFIHHVLERRVEEGQFSEAYLCGPPVMIDAVIKVLKEKGFNDKNIFFDKF